MSEDELDYLGRRAEVELEMAQRSQSQEVTAAHYQLAEAYLERIQALDAATEKGGQNAKDSALTAEAADGSSEAEPSVSGKGRL